MTKLTEQQKGIIQLKTLQLKKQAIVLGLSGRPLKRFVERGVKKWAKKAVRDA
jgi:hypothetical protein